MDMAVSAPADVPLGFVDKLRALLACAVAVVLLRQLGWLVARPADPEMAVTFTTSGRAVLAIWPALTVLTVVTALAGMIIAGKRLPEGGVFAACVGLVGLELRGGSMQQLLTYVGTNQAAGRRALMINLGIDALLWAGVIAVAWVAVAMAHRWLWPPGEEPEPGEAVPRPSARAALAASWKLGWQGLVVTTVVGALVVWLTVERNREAVVMRGQVIASVAAALYLGAMAARYFTHSPDIRWCALAALLVALIAYLLGYLNADLGWAREGRQLYAELPGTPPHALVRPLPVEYLAVGVAAALAGYWGGQRVEHLAEQEAAR